MIKAASDRHAPAEEACKLIRNFGQAELKMMKYVESHGGALRIPPQVTEQLKGGHKNTEMMEQKVCNAAEQQQTRAPAGPSLSEVLGSATALPEATKTKKGRQHLRHTERQRADAMNAVRRRNASRPSAASGKIASMNGGCRPRC